MVRAAGVVLHVAVPDVVPEPAVRGAPPGEQSAAKRRRQRVVLPRGDARHEVRPTREERGILFERNAAEGRPGRLWEKNLRRPQRGDVSVVHARVHHAEPSSSAVPPREHGPVAKRHHRMELGTGDGDRVVAKTAGGIVFFFVCVFENDVREVHASRRRDVVASAVAESVVHTRAPAVYGARSVVVVCVCHSPSPRHLFRS